MQNEYRTIKLEDRNHKFLDDKAFINHITHSKAFINDISHESENDKTNEKTYDKENMLYSLFKVNK